MKETTWSGYIDSNFPKLEKNLNCEVLVIGGGICGILCAYYLKKSGKKVVILEADEICNKKTLKTTATITAIEDLMYYELIRDLGFKNAKLYLEANLFAINEYKKLANEIDFDFEECTSYKYSIDDCKEIELEVEAIKKLGYECSLKDELDLPIKIKKALEFNKQAQMNPLKLINTLIKDLEIYENSRVTKISKNVAYTEEYSVSFNNVIVATGFPFLRFKGMYFMKMYQKKSHVIEVSNDFNFKGNCVGTHYDDYYVRNYKENLLIGSSDIKTGYKGSGFNKINDLINDKFDNKNIKNRWINIDCITLDGLPYIGRYCKGTNNIFVATGFNMWGMTKSMLSAHLILDLIDGNDNKFENLFSPSRRMVKKQLFYNIMNSTKSLLTFEKKRCKHLGCALHYNSVDKTYECRCHGSKYDEKGNIIDTPTQKNM